MGEVRERYAPRLVLPGEILCAPEEFLPGPGTYTASDSVRAAVAGVSDFDFKTRIVSVKPARPVNRLPRQGDVVIGVVVNTRDEIATVKILGPEKEGSYSSPFTGIIHVSQASDKFIRTVEEAVRLGDLVKARVLNDSVPYQLTIKDPQLGVIAALCTRCGGLLVRKAGSLVCSRCGNREERKISIDYVFSERDAGKRRSTRRRNRGRRR